MERLHGLGENVRAIVADELEGARVLAGDELDLGVAPDRIVEIGERAVERHRDRALRQRLRDALFGDGAAGDAGLVLPLRAVGECQGDHERSAPAHSCERGR
jgi:hypothetical protein